MLGWQGVDVIYEVVEIVITSVETTKDKYASLADKLCGIIPDNGQDYKEMVQEVIEDKFGRK